jgi:WD40 repeat protein
VIASQHAAAFTADGRTAATGSLDQTVKLWDTSTGRVRHTLAVNKGEVRSIAISPDDTTLAVALAEFDDAGKVYISGAVELWDVKTAQRKTTLFQHTEAMSGVAFSPDGRTVAAGSHDQLVRLWDVNSGKLTATLKGHREWLKALAFSPDGRLLASGSGDHTIRLWDVKTDKLTMTLEGHARSVSVVAFSGDGQTLVSGSWDRTVRLWNVTTGQVTSTMVGHANWVSSVAFSREGWAASASIDRSVRLWDTRVDVEVERSTRRDADAVWQESWHERLATEAEKHQAWFTARWHLSRLLLDKPKVADLLRRHGRVVDRLKAPPPMQPLLRE